MTAGLSVIADHAFRKEGKYGVELQSSISSFERYESVFHVRSSIISLFSVTLSSESISRLDRQADMKHETRDDLLAFPRLCFRLRSPRVFG